MQTWHKQYGDVFTIRMGSKYMVVICSDKVQATEKRERLWAVFCLWVRRVLWKTLWASVTSSSASRGGDVAVDVFNINQPSLPISLLTKFCSCVYFCPYSHFNCISFHNSPDNSPLSLSVLPVLFLPYWSFQLYISLWKSHPWYNPLWLTGLKAPTN